MKKSKFVLLFLTINTFVIGLCEFISSGISVNIAKQFNISVANAGLSTTLYALAVLISAPILISLTSSFNKKTLLIAIAINYALANLIVALAPNFIIMIIGRIMSGCSHGLFMSIGTLVATQITKKEKQGQAIAIMFSGLTIATILGVPLGSFLANHISWRIIFSGVSILSVITALMYLTLPNNLQPGQKITLLSHKKLWSNKQNVSSLFLTAFGYGGVFAIYAMIVPFIQKLVHVNSDVITILLLIIGLFVAIGNIIGGKISNKNTNKVLMKIFPLQILSYLLFYFVKNEASLYIVCAFFGLLIFMNVSGLQLLNIEVSKKLNPDVVDVTSSYNISAFNLGIAFGSFIGELGFEHIGYQSLPILATIIVSIALLIQVFNKKLNVN